jgi:hypothetical protein
MKESEAAPQAVPNCLPVTLGSVPAADLTAFGAHGRWE